MAQKDNDKIEPEIIELAEEITRYLNERKLAADTVEGITRWWILRQRLSEGKRRVALAMEYLCEQGLVNVRQLPDGQALYSSALYSSVSVEAKTGESVNTKEQKH